MQTRAVTDPLAVGAVLLLLAHAVVAVWLDLGLYADGA
jgi:hypothetical protein